MVSSSSQPLSRSVAQELRRVRAGPLYSSNIERRGQGGDTWHPKQTCIKMVVMLWVLQCRSPVWTVGVDCQEVKLCVCSVWELWICSLLIHFVSTRVFQKNLLQSSLFTSTVCLRPKTCQFWLPLTDGWPILQSKPHCVIQTTLM